MIEVRLGTNWYVLRIILLELSRQNFLSPVTVPPKITVRELHCGLPVAQTLIKELHMIFQTSDVSICNGNMKSPLKNINFSQLILRSSSFMFLLLLITVQRVPINIVHEKFADFLKK